MLIIPGAVAAAGNGKVAAHAAGDGVADKFNSPAQHFGRRKQTLTPDTRKFNVANSGFCTFTKKKAMLSFVEFLGDQDPVLAIRQLYSPGKPLVNYNGDDIVTGAIQKLIIDLELTA